ncbi:unnamed protein product [Rotaria socialis]|uniref:Uncharacterized protein n=1 Tax=Rotaria socialis TaxID=392032 RepID=A0A821LWX0_9BILA|nr:unnamed protein product [Rotaria socialis]CAF4757079.1 unnamed protein product [Rotaria socialis]
MGGLYLINHECPSRYTNEYIEHCASIDDFKIHKEDHYGIATIENLNLMNNTNLNEPVKHHEGEVNIRPSENHFNLFDDDSNDSESSTSSNSTGEQDVDLSIWNDKDSNMEYSSDDDDDDELVNKYTE